MKYEIAALGLGALFISSLPQRKVERYFFALAGIAFLAVAAFYV